MGDKELLASIFNTKLENILTKILKDNEKVRSLMQKAFAADQIEPIIGTYETVPPVASNPPTAKEPAITKVEQSIKKK